ncbi:MAG: hypothetical protein WDZ48_00130, partial [Pirellulales bacterium]
AAARADVVSARSELYAGHAAKLDDLAASCQEQRLDDAVKTLASWLPKREPGQLTLFLPASPAVSNAARNLAELPEWRKRWQSLRNAQADALMALARQAVAEKRSSLAYELAVEAVRENPDHEQARKILGYARFQGGWHTPFEIRQLRSGKVWHEKFGWLSKERVERYEKGDRFALGRWMKAEEEAALRRDMSKGWRVETEHYLVTTNHSLEEGVALARRLEALFGIWRQVFAPYLVGEAELARRFEGRGKAGIARQHNVYYYRTRGQYNDALRAAQPKIEITLGIYFDSSRIAYFFAGEDQDPGTIYHEATHQLFHETRDVAPQVARENNFWIVEGIACYMESLQAHDGHYTLGGANAGRMPAARHRLLTDHYYIPLAQLVQFGMEGMQQDPNIARLYSQSAGLADFFMHDAVGRYREPLIRYLGAVYAGRATPDSLAEMTASSYESLDREYRAFMSQGETAEKSTGKAGG